jgi:hypothetical protein
LAAFEGLTTTVHPVETVLYGPVQDQAALYGLLDRIQSLARVSPLTCGRELLSLVRARFRVEQCMT